MDHKIMERAINVMTMKDVSASAKVLYSVLCSGSEPTPDNSEVYLNAYNQDQIRELTGINSKGTIIKAQKELEGMGLIGIMKKPKSWGNVYMIY